MTTFRSKNFSERVALMLNPPVADYLRQWAALSTRDKGEGMKTTTKHKSEKQPLPVQFTRDELQDIGLRLASVMQSIGESERKKKRDADAAKEELDALKAAATRLANDRVNGYEFRFVDVDIFYDFENAMKRTVRLDTGEIVEEKPMTDQERQLTIAAVESVTPAEKTQ